MSTETEVQFLCGCSHKVTALYGPQGMLTDEQLFALCPVHMVRRRGWRSPLIDEYQAHPIREGHVILRPNWSRSDQENEVEFWRRLGVDILRAAIEDEIANTVASDDMAVHRA